jgi:acyl dehydratase
MSGTATTTPEGSLYFEDYPPGAMYEFGSTIVEEAEVIAFAQRFDPQPFHIDPAAARESIFGGLIASGWHTASLTMRMLVEHSISRESSLGSPGVDKLRWLKPVRPGDVLSLRVTVLGTKRLRSQPDRGIVRLHVEVLNQDSEIVMTMEPMGLLRCREADERG